jgi:hypothetical protein
MPEPRATLSLSRKGVTLLGSIEDITTGGSLKISNNRKENINTSLDTYNMYYGMIKGCADKQSPEVQATWKDETVDPTHDPITELLESDGPSEIPSSDIQGIIWCTGYTKDLSFLDIANCEGDFDPKTGYPDTLQSRNVPGLWYTGFPWVHHIQSVNIVGFEKDHELLVSLMLDEKVE